MNCEDKRIKGAFLLFHNLVGKWQSYSFSLNCLSHGGKNSDGFLLIGVFHFLAVVKGRAATAGKNFLYGSAYALSSH